MADDLDESARWRDEIETRVGTLEVTAEAQALVRAKVLAVLKTIVDVLDNEIGQTAE